MNAGMHLLTNHSIIHKRPAINTRHSCSCKEVKVMYWKIWVYSGEKRTSPSHKLMPYSKTAELKIYLACRWENGWSMFYNRNVFAYLQRVWMNRAQTEASLCWWENLVLHKENELHTKGNYKIHLPGSPLPRPPTPSLYFAGEMVHLSFSQNHALQSKCHMRFPTTSDLLFW